MCRYVRENVRTLAHARAPRSYCWSLCTGVMAIYDLDNLRLPAHSQTECGAYQGMTLARLLLPLFLWDGNGNKKSGWSESNGHALCCSYLSAFLARSLFLFLPPSLALALSFSISLALACARYLDCMATLPDSTREKDDQGRRCRNMCNWLPSARTRNPVVSTVMCHVASACPEPKLRYSSGPQEPPFALAFMTIRS